MVIFCETTLTMSVFYYICIILLITIDLITTKYMASNESMVDNYISI